jgi:methanogenic corrinoid protein MtbC1
MDDDPATDIVDPGTLSRNIVAPPFVSPEIRAQVNFSARGEKVARLIETEIVPRLITLHSETGHASAVGLERPTEHEIASLARMILGSDIGVSSNYISELKDRGLSMEGLFVNLLEPTARYLGTMWENDECDFIDVTLGVARLQQLLSMFNCSYAVPAFIEKRRVCMMTLAEEKHSFGVSMVEKFLRAGGWRVHLDRGVAAGQIPPLATQWHAVAGLTIGSEARLDDLAAIIQSIRQHSCNPSIGIMVGGPPFAQHPELAARVGADATAVDAPTAVLLAQKLFDIGARTNWEDSYNEEFCDPREND